MNIICKLFGCAPNPRDYGKYWGGCTDGIGREHGFYYWECKRCSEPIYMRVHIPRKEKDND